MPAGTIVILGDVELFCGDKGGAAQAVAEGPGPHGRGPGRRVRRQEIAAPSGMTRTVRAHASCGHCAGRCASQYRRRRRPEPALMVAARGRRVRRQEIAAAVWDDQDRDVRTLMWSLRRALRDASTAVLTFRRTRPGKAITFWSSPSRTPWMKRLTRFASFDLTAQAEALLEERRRGGRRRAAYRRGGPVGRRAVRGPVARRAAGSVQAAQGGPGARARPPRPGAGRVRAPPGRAVRGGPHLPGPSRRAGGRRWRRRRLAGRPPGHAARQAGHRRGGPAARGAPRRRQRRPGQGAGHRGRRPGPRRRPADPGGAGIDVHRPLTDAPRPPVTGSPLSLVGRETELAAFRRVLREVRAGHPATLAVRGGSGLGKTRLADELAASAVSARVPVILVSAAHRRGPAALAGARRTAVARRLPGHRGRPGPGAGPADPGPAARAA